MNALEEIVAPIKDIREMNALGLTHFYELRFVRPTPPWWTSVVLLVVATFQVCAGVFLTGVSGGIAANIGWAAVQR